MTCAETHFEYQGYCCWSDGSQHIITDLSTGRIVLERHGSKIAFPFEVEEIRRRQREYDEDEIVFRGNDEGALG